VNIEGAMLSLMTVSASVERAVELTKEIVAYLQRRFAREVVPLPAGVSRALLRCGDVSRWVCRDRTADKCYGDALHSCRGWSRLHQTVGTVA
jgi:hypothetical protein